MLARGDPLGREGPIDVEEGLNALAALFAGQVVDCFLYEPVTLLVMMACAASVAAPRPEP